MQCSTKRYARALALGRRDRALGHQVSATDFMSLDGHKMLDPRQHSGMMGGEGPFGSAEMGGMFSVVKAARRLPGARACHGAVDAASSRSLAELIAAERELDQLFSSKHAASAAIDRATQRVGLLQAQLRAEHLKTHLSQTASPSVYLIRDYAALRGYASPNARAVAGTASRRRGGSGAAPSDAASPSHQHH